MYHIVPQLNSIEKTKPVGRQNGKLSFFRNKKMKKDGKLLRVLVVDDEHTSESGNYIVQDCDLCHDEPE